MTLNSNYIEEIDDNNLHLFIDDYYKNLNYKSNQTSKRNLSIDQRLMHGSYTSKI